MSDDRAGRFRTRIARGRLSSECTTGLPVGVPELVELVLLLLLPQTFEPLGLFKPDEEGGTATADCKFRVPVRLLDTLAIGGGSTSLPPTGLQACECDEAVEDDEDEELCDEL